MSDQNNVTLDFIGRTLLEVQADQRRQRTDLSDIRSLVLSQIDYSRRVERRLSEMRDDLEMMFKSELMGRVGNFEIRIGQTISEMDLRICALETDSIAS